MIISLDLDGVLARFVSEFAQWINSKSKLDINSKTLRSFEEALKTDRKGADEKIFEFYQKKGVKTIKPVNGSIEAVKELIKQGNRLIVLTSRSKLVEEETREWLGKYFPDIKEFILTDYENNGRKHNYCVKMKVDYHIDDYLKHAKSIADKNIKVILLNQPWNLHEDANHPNIERAKDWNEIVEKLKARAG